MKFFELTSGVEGLSLIAGGNADVRGLQYDSRKVRGGDCFLAIKGETTDGNVFLDRAIAAGASAVVTDSPTDSPRGGVGWAKIASGSGRRAMGVLSANFYARPTTKLHITGITGTNGKTTTSFVLEAILSAARRKSALIGTVEYRIGNRVVASPHTTPESLDLNRFLAEAVGEEATETIMEVSSHALAQERVYGVPFDVAVFTNLTRDHLDYHRDMDDYFSAKRMLFAGTGTPPPRVAIINQDDEYGRKLIEFSRGNGSQVVTYGMDSGDFHAANVDLTPVGTRFELVTTAEKMNVNSPLVGRVNVYNILAAAAAATARGCSLEQVREGVNRLQRVPGRFERVDAGQTFTVVVDYAHTDDALRNLIEVARDFVSRTDSKGRVITVFGCGGDRDRTKRPLMGKAAGEGSDFVLLTSDNPRSEDPLAIMHDVLPGLRSSGAEFSVEPDRGRAIELAIRIARLGDIVLIAGKGHEKVQITRAGSQPFDDVAVAASALEAAGCRAGQADRRSSTVASSGNFAGGVS